MSSPAVVDIHNPAWWRREDDIFDAQLDAYDGVPMTEEVRATLLMMAWAEIAQLRIVQKVMALEGYEPPRRPGRPPKVRDPASEHRRCERAREISVSANEGQVELMHRKLSADEARELGARLIQAAEHIEMSNEQGGDE